MNSELKKIISKSTFSISNETFIYTKVSRIPSGQHFLVSQDSDEITVVTTSDRIAELELIERNKEDYTLIALNVLVPFYSVGFLAAVSQAIAEQGLNILIVSTYSKDYILVKKSKSSVAKKALLKLGFKEKTSERNETPQN